MARSLVPVVLIAILAGALGLALRLASLLQALFQRLGRLEHARDNRGARFAEVAPHYCHALDALLVEDLLRVAQTPGTTPCAPRGAGVAWGLPHGSPRGASQAPQALPGGPPPPSAAPAREPLPLV